jgi:hypothetical protein
MFRYVLCPLLLAGCLMPLDADAFEPGLTPRDSVLVLRNGGILSGQVTRAGDRYVVIMGDRAEVRVPVLDVEMHCIDLDEVYQRKRSRLAVNDVTGHVALADWCLQQKLFSRAADELLTVIALQPAHPRLAGLERRLQLAVELPELGSPQTKPQGTLVGLADLEKTTRSLSPKAIEDFTTQIQPLLLNRCGANSCHGDASPSEFRLVRPAWTKTISRRFTQRNLHAVLQFVESENADSSPLLTVPATAHGGMETGVFGPREREHFDLLADWVRQATTADSAPVPETIDPAPYGLLQASFSQPVELPRPMPDESQPTAALRPDGSARPVVHRLETPGGFVPRDAFDAEIFNRRWRAEGEASTRESDGFPR